MNLRLLTYNVFGMPWGLQSIESVLLWVMYETDAEILCFQELFSEEHKQAIQQYCWRKDSQWTCWFPEVEPTCLSRLFSCFSSISGLCILVKKTVDVVSPPVFQPFSVTASLDSYVRKGFFHIECKKDGILFHIVTTHFQSDFTECKCRIRYQDIRQQQEQELYSYCKQFQKIVITGDFNMNRFRYFQPVNTDLQSTFPETGESLDHCLQLSTQPISCLSTTYFQTVKLSDHIPVLFTLGFTNS
jgi:exonuclease III